MWDYEDTHMLIARMGSLEFRVAFLQTEIKKMFQVSSGGGLIIWSSWLESFKCWSISFWKFGFWHFVMTYEMLIDFAPMCACMLLLCEVKLIHLEFIHWVCIKVFQILWLNCMVLP